MSWSSVPQVVETTLNIFRLIASTKKPRVPVAQRQAGKDSQLVTLAGSASTDCIVVFMSLRMVRACANLVAVKPPAEAICSIRSRGVVAFEKS